MLRFILGLLYFFRFHFVFFICRQLRWIRGLRISFTSFLFPVKGRSKKFEDWQGVSSFRIGKGGVKRVREGRGVKILGLGGYHFFEREVSTSLPAMLFLFLF